VTGPRCAAGLLHRTPDPDDRRNRIVTLTDAGRTLLADCRRDIRAMEADLLSTLHAPDRVRPRAIKARRVNPRRHWRASITDRLLGPHRLRQEHRVLDVTTGLSRWFGELVASPLVQPDVAGAEPAGEEDEAGNGSGGQGLRTSEKPAPDSPPGEVWCHHQATDLPCVTGWSCSHSRHQSVLTSNAENSPAGRPLEDIGGALVQRGDTQGVVEDGFLDPATALKYNQLGKIALDERRYIKIGQCVRFQTVCSPRGQRRGRAQSSQYGDRSSGRVRPTGRLGTAAVLPAQRGEHVAIRIG